MRKYCLDCPRAFEGKGSRCYLCSAIYKAQKAGERLSPLERGYDATYLANKKLVLTTQLWCHYCGYVPAEGETLTVDHKQPLSRGGTNDIDNLVAACKKDNEAKGNRTEVEYREYMKSQEIATNGN